MTEPLVKTYKRKSTERVRALRYLGELPDPVPGLDEKALNDWGVKTERRDGDLYIWVEKSAAFCRVAPGTWVIAEADGSGFYPCTQSDFWRTYEVPE